MQSLILKLQADVDARKRPRTEVWPVLRVGVLLLVLCLTAFAYGVSASEDGAWSLRADARQGLLSFNADADALAGTVAIQRAQIERLERAVELSTRYAIGADLAMMIEDIALAENVDPELAFELVRLESQFNPRALSPVGAVGLAQVMPATARLLSPGITRQELFEPETNLRLGFRFFHSLLEYYKGDVRLALLAYNRGPATVDRLLQQGVDPANGYARIILTRRDANR